MIRGSIRPAGILGAAAVLAALAVASSGSGYETLGLKWQAKRASYRINPNFPSTVGTSDQQVELLRCAADSWRNQSAADFNFDFAGLSTRNRVDENDNVNVLFSSPDDPNDALAATFIFGFAGRFDGFDMVFFASTGGIPNRWVLGREPGPGEIDLRGTAVHEFGHALGLAHSPIRDSTMFEFITGRGVPLRTLHADDIAGVEFLYKTRTGASTVPRIDLITPGVGPITGGNELLIQGFNFTAESDTLLRIGTLQISANNLRVETCSRMRVLSVPAQSAGLRDVSIANILGNFILPNGYRFATLPGLATVEPAEGPITGGSTIRIRGSNFIAGATVTIDGTPLQSARLVDSETIEGVLPEGTRAGPVDVRIEQSGENAVLINGFTYRGEVLEVVGGRAIAGTAGNPVDIQVTSPIDLAGITAAIIFQPLEIEVEELSTAGTAAETADFQEARLDAAAGTATLRVVMNSAPGGPKVFPAGTARMLARALLKAPAAAVPRTVLRLADGAGSPPVDNRFTPAGGGSEITPLLLDGVVTIAIAGSFIRGNANSDAGIDIADPVSILVYLFSGQEEPACLDAADTNDDGLVDISDAISILEFLFLGGNPPAPPYPDPGTDPTADPLTCG